jgi:hypothetical protein
LRQLGEDILSTGFENRIQHRRIYLVVPMSKIDLLRNETMMFGIRFKPGAFPNFCKCDSLDKMANTFCEFPAKDFPDLEKALQHFVPYLDQFFLDRLTPAKQSVLLCATDLTRSAGAVSIQALAKNTSQANGS